MLAAALGVAAPLPRLQAQAVQKLAESGGNDPLTALVRQLGLPAGVGFIAGLIWAVINQADKLEKVFRWFGWPPPPKLAASPEKVAEGAQSPLGQQLAANNQGNTYQAGGNIQINFPPPAPQPDPKLQGGRRLDNLPPAIDGFVARDEQLNQLLEVLGSPGSQLVIHGLPGVGKTSLALHFAVSSANHFPGGGWWLEASEGFEPMALRACVELEDRIDGLGSGDGLEPEARLRRCWQAWPVGDDDPVLLVVDNLPSGPGGQEIQRRLATGLPPRFRRLITQRTEPLTSGAAIDLPVLKSQEALELLKIRAGEHGCQRIEREQQEALALVADVEGLPLALVLLAGRLRRVPALSLEALRRDLARPELGAEAFSQANAELLAERSLVATLLASWATLSDEGRELARLLSLTLAAPIPWELIERCDLASPLESTGQRWHNALADLLGANLLDRLDGERDFYHLHPLVRQFFGIQRQGWRQEGDWRRRLAATAWQLAHEQEGLNVIASVDYWRQACLADPQEARAGFGLGYGLIQLGDLGGAMQAFDQSLQNARQAKDQRGTSIAFTGIGDVLLAQGDSAGALAAYEAGLTIREGLAKRDPANTEWQVDLAASCCKLGSLDSLLSISTRKEYLCRGREILLALKRSERLHASQDFIGWFDQVIQKL